MKACTKAGIILRLVVLVSVMWVWVLFGAFATHHELNKAELNKPKVCRSQVSGQRIKCP